MAIEKNSFKVARFDLEFQSPHSRDTHMSSDDDEDIQRNPSASAVESDDDDDYEFDDCDSGAGSDDFDLLELGETGEEFCQVGDQTCSIPYELYDLPGLKDVLSMEVWNEVLTEEERFGLSKYLPDLDQESFARTMKELFSGDNLHFGSPIDELFEVLKGGLCEPRVALYRKGLNFFQRRQHYHNLQKHNDAMVNNLCQIRDAWQSCKGYSIEEKLRVLNIMRSQKSLMNENMEEVGSESSDREDSGDGLWDKKLKDLKLGQKGGRYLGSSTGLASDVSSRSRIIKSTMEPAKTGKQDPLGILKMAGSKASSVKELSEPFPSSHPGVEMMSGRYGLGLPISQYKKDSGFNSSAAVGKNEQILDDDDEAETMVEVAVHRDRKFRRVGANKKPAASKWKKHEDPIADEDTDGLMKILMSGRNNLHALGRNKAINKLSDIKVLTAKPTNARNIYDGGRKMKYSENLQLSTPENQMNYGKGQKSRSSLRGSERELLDANDPAWFSKHGGLFPADLSSKPSDLNGKRKKWKMNRQGIDLNVNDKLLHTEYRANILQDRFQASSLNERTDGAGSRGIGPFSKNEDTESDSSEHMNEDGDDNPLMRSKWAYPGGVPDLDGPDMKNTQLLKRDKKDGHSIFDGSSHSSRRMEDYNQNLDLMGAEQKSKMHDVGYFNMPAKGLDKNYLPGVIGDDVRQQFYHLGRTGHVEGIDGDISHMSSMKPSLTLGRRRKGEVSHDFGLLQSNYMHDHKLENDLYWTRPPAAANGVPFKMGKKGPMVELSVGHHPEISDVSLIGCNALSKKRKVQDDFAYMELHESNRYLRADAELQLDDASSLRKHGKSKLEDVSDGLENGVPQPPVTEMGMEDVEAETKRQKKSFPLITPTVHTGFSFSIIHLLSSVRMAMITMLPDDSSEARKDLDKDAAEQGAKEEQNGNQENSNVDSNSNMGVSTSVPSSQANVPSLAVQEIVNRVRSNPGDPCILETQEPLQDLVRGVLKIFSSRTAPLGAKGWKSLVVYQKSTKSWSWIGPVSHNLSDSEAVEEVTSPDAWGLPHKMLVKLVDSFANWLKNSQETLQQIGSLPSPPLSLMQINLDEKERFKDLRAQKSLNTISPSSEEVKAYFQQEEVLRYLIPDRAFSYTAVDGKKSIVAPLRRCGGKPTSKARDHFMLKRNRPPHVTILCLVRDAAARLPGSIGTRADVCTLIRDSQYIVEDVSDAQVNQVVSGALDRLHYERDPCVQFDGERKLWVYLHREREEEDFEDDGTSSTKKWRRQKKEAAEPSEAGDVTVAYPGAAGESGFDLVSDLNVETLCADDDKRSELDCQNGNDQMEYNAETNHGSDGMWNGLGIKSIGENKLICQENSTNEDFDEEAFGGDPPA